MLGLVLSAALSVSGTIVSPANSKDGIQEIRRGDYVAALKTLVPLADQGDMSAQYALGFLYKHGDGVKKDAVQAARWFEKSASQGHDVAQLNLGFMYLTGEGRARNYMQAVMWFHEAAIRNNTAAQSNLGTMYRRGYGVAKNETRAAAWFGLAAGKDSAEAQANLASLYCEGQGVKKDLVACYALFELSAPTLKKNPAFVQSVVNNLAAAKKHLTKAQLEEAHAVASDMRKQGILKPLLRRKSAPPGVPPRSVRPAGANLGYMHAHPPVYPAAAIQSHHEGTVVVLGLLSPLGQIMSATVESSSGYRELDESGLNAVRSWTFTACQADGIPESCYVREPVVFALTK